MRACSSVVVSSLLLLSASVSSAAAQYHGDDDEQPNTGELAGRVRFHLEMPLFDYQSVSQSIEVAGMERDSSITTIAVGPIATTEAGTNVAAGIGYAVTDAIVIGAGVGFGYAHQSTDDPDDFSASRMTLSLSPYFEYMGGDNSTKPFLGAMLQAQHVATSTDAFGEEDEESRTFAGAGLIGGAHFFTSSGCSIDLAAKLSYSTLVSSDPELPDDSSISILDFLVTLGVSAWVL